MPRLLIFQPRQAEPTPPDRVLRSTWHVGCRTVTMVQHLDIIPGSYGTLRVEWAPDRPPRLSKREWLEYRAGRDAHHQKIANIIGGTIACAEL